MISIDEVNNAIQELENGDTTFNSCQKLASLYIVREKYKNVLNDEIQSERVVLDELNDILPSYKSYCSTKREYQLGKTTKIDSINHLHFVCTEIKEFIQSLYTSTDCDEERNEIVTLLTSLLKDFN